MIYFYGDPHFGDANILLYDGRPFENVSQMDEKLIQYYNYIITDDDKVYFTGDIGAEGYEKDILARLKGEKYLIKGNHDVKSNQDYRNFGFIEVYDHPILLEDFWMISHEPMYVTELMPYANIFAHVHTNPMYKTCSTRSYCSCIDRNDWRPVSFVHVKNEITKCNKERTITKI